MYNKNLALLEKFKNAAKDIYGVNLMEAEHIQPGELILNSELFFKGWWSKRFENRSVYKSPFFIGDEETIEVDTMHSTGNYYYYEDKELKADFVEIPFKGQEVSLTVVLPHEGNTLERIEENLVTVLAKKTYKPTYMKMSLPKFTVKSENDFTDILKKVNLRIHS